MVKGVKGINILSEKEKEILEIIEKFIDENGYSPTVREIAALSGLKSTSSVHGHIKRLKTKGLLTKGEEGMPRSITIKKEIRNIKLVVNTISIIREFNKEYILLEKVAGQHKDNSDEEIFELPSKTIENSSDVYKIIREKLDYYGVEVIKIYGETLHNGLCKVIR